MTFTLASRLTGVRRSSGTSPANDRVRDPAFQAFLLLRIGFTAAPVVFGLDKFAHVLVNWDRYLAPVIVRQTPWTAHQLMYVVGAIEILAGLVVAVRPRLGGYVVAAWLAGIIINLLLIPGFYDIAFRDFGLLIGAMALNRLAAVFDAGPLFRSPTSAAKDRARSLQATGGRSV